MKSEICIPCPQKVGTIWPKKDAFEQWTSVTCYQPTCICNKQSWPIPNGKQHIWKLCVLLKWNSFPSIIFKRKCAIQPENLYSYLPYILLRILKQIFSGYIPHFLLNLHKAIWAVLWNLMLSVNIPYILWSDHGHFLVGQDPSWAGQSYYP
jgi:hypothetical protein